MQKAADGMARKAAQNLWTAAALEKQFKELAALHADFEAPKADKTLLQRKAEVLVPALDRIWRALGAGKSGVPAQAECDGLIKTLHFLALDHEDFDPLKFSGELGRLKVAFAGLGAGAAGSNKK